MEALPRVLVQETASETLLAAGAKLAVRISGQSFFTGAEAFKKATEVAACIEAVKGYGVTESDCQLPDVSIEVASGFLSKSSSATYHIEIHCRSLELLGRVLSAVAAQKNAQVTSVGWQYPDLEKSRREVRQRAVRAAKDAAQSIADTLGVALLGVNKLSYSTSGGDADVSIHAERARGRFLAAADFDEAADLSSMNLSHTCRLAVTIEAEFLVGHFVGSE